MTGKSEPLTLDELRDLERNQLTYRFSKDRSQRKRPPRLDRLAASIVNLFPYLDVAISDWRYQFTRHMSSGLIYHYGRERRGKRLTVFRRGGTTFLTADIFYEVNLADPFHTHWEVIGWIVRDGAEDNARARKMTEGKAVERQDS